LRNHNRIWLMAPDGGERRALTPKSLEATMPAVYTGDVTIVIFANRATAYRVVDALKPVNQLAVDAGAGLGNDLPPPVPGALAGKLLCRSR
jgi:hypothetical protein